MNSKVDFFFDKAEKWQEEFQKLRSLILDCELTEELKWGVPCYTYNNTNVILIHGFKAYCAVLFHKGALLKDTENILIQQTKNVQAARQIRFANVQQIIDLEKTIKAYIYEAVEVERAGLKVNYKKTEEYPVPEEFQKQLDANADLKKAFEALTPGRQRAYLFYFSQPKQSKTKASRIDKCIPGIFEGKGLNDR